MPAITLSHRQKEGEQDLFGQLADLLLMSALTFIPAFRDDAWTSLPEYHRFSILRQHWVCSRDAIEGQILDRT